MYMFPFSFDEFLWASGETLLLETKQKANAKNPLPDIIHQKLLSLLKRFLVLGGMPLYAVSNFLRVLEPDTQV